jgi:16S rRNA (adenine1518-N6/adenine1519-N6)-dimethyltransferase
VTHSRRRLLALLDDAGITLSRSLGQNYVADPNTVRRIARLAGVGPGDRVVEIGAGVGSLTLALAETGAEIVAVETDRHVLPVLRAVLQPAVAGSSAADDAGASGRAGPVTIVEGDALTFGWVEALQPAGSEWSMVANLPYNIAVPLLLDTLARVPQVRSFLVMVQREVAERLAAGPGSRVYGIPSVKRAWWADATVVSKVPASVFVPTPRVESALLRVDRRPPPDTVVPAAEVFALVEAAFGQRRKMLRRSLGSRPDFEARAQAAGVATDSRPEQLDLACWVALAEHLRS